MNTINSALKQISIFKLAAVLLLIFLIAVIFDFDGIFDFLEIILLLFFIYKFKDCKADFKKKFKGIFSQRYLKNIFIIVILNILFSYGMIYFILFDSLLHSRFIFPVYIFYRWSEYSFRRIIAKCYIIGSNCRRAIV